MIKNQIKSHRVIWVKFPRSHFAKFAGIILALHIVRGRNIFVTKDKGFFKKGKNEQLEQEFPQIKIRYFNKELIEELEEQRSTKRLLLRHNAQTVEELQLINELVAKSK